MTDHRLNAPRSTLRAPRRPAVALAALAILVGLAYAVWGSPSVTPAYQAGDVVREKPMHGGHEIAMDAAPIAIPFLPADGPQPRIDIPVDSYDFASIAPAERVAHVFVIRNAGQAPLTISRLYTTCGCTLADLSGSVIPPGKLALLTVTFDAGLHDVRGQTVRRGVMIENNDPTRPLAEIWIQATVRSR